MLYIFRPLQTKKSVEKTYIIDIKNIYTSPFERTTGNGEEEKNKTTDIVSYWYYKWVSHIPYMLYVTRPK